MFSEKSINIHYKAPASQLLKMNTFNEFELNRIKRLYADELATRLQRSKSGKLASSAAAAGAGRTGATCWHLPARELHKRRVRQQQQQVAAADTCQPPLPRQFQPTAADVVDLNRYERALAAKAASAASRRAAERSRFGCAKYDFMASDARELSVKRGDLVELLEPLDENWLQVEDCQSGLQGLVPLAYLDISVGCAVAKRDVSSAAAAGDAAKAAQVQPPPAPQLLQMNKGEPIVLLRRLSGHLYEATNTRRAMGLVLSNDVEVLEQPIESAAGGGVAAADDDNDDEQLLAAGRRRARSACDCRRQMARAAAECQRQAAPGGAPHLKCLSSCPTSAACQHDQLPAGETAPCSWRRRPAEKSKSCRARRSSSSPMLAAAAATAASGAEEDADRPLPRLCRAKFAYAPRQKDELELAVGDILVVVHQCDDGWLIGSSYASKQIGTFPGNFVEFISCDEDDLVG